MDLHPDWEPIWLRMPDGWRQAISPCMDAVFDPPGNQQVWLIFERDGSVRWEYVDA